MWQKISYNWGNVLIEVCLVFTATGSSSTSRFLPALSSSRNAIKKSQFTYYTLCVKYKGVISSLHLCLRQSKDAQVSSVVNPHALFCILHHTLEC